MLTVVPTIDAYTPREIAQKVETLGVTKARSETLSVLVLAVLAGAFIALGALFFTVVVTRPVLGFGVSRLAGGVAFSLGLILVVIGGAELFTGNNLVAMAWASRRITSVELCRNWLLVYVGNAVGALGTVALVLLGHVEQFGDGAVRETALAIGRHKAALGVVEALALGVLCNALVCLAVWLAMGGAECGRQGAGDRVPDHGVRHHWPGAFDCQHVLPALRGRPRWLRGSAAPGRRRAESMRRNGGQRPGRHRARGRCLLVGLSPPKR
jgi:hypothetical protein